MSSFLGVDLGATWLRICLSDGRRAVWTEKVPARDWRELPGMLTRLLRRRGPHRVARLSVGGARLGAVKDRAALRRALAPLARRVRVVPDFEIAHLAAFGRGPGVLLAAGTGSVAFARGTDGRTTRAGGLGPLLGDEGSGFWLGREALRDPVLSRSLPRALRVAHAEDPVRATAALAPRVLRRSRRLREKAAEHLCGLARRAARGPTLPRPKPLALHGSLFKNAALRRAVLRRLGGGWQAVAPRVSAEKAAAGL
ncbi:MAG TPA: hypothetical protein DCZ01_06760 [Elusimicrobia bacterium]|nr:MAG: hypothetical protein A2X37_01575 [Elusimicrobia bacterium GWA2_66_18]OGR70089.1 MAG: hypothetical protein A2X40_02365 [Elusimicrobia bacterium GWC2_65_9]HAZ08210.1 hypothetical protein [Elusimicrobiota bacterium]